METKQVRAGRDTILGPVERASPVDVIAELIWNALDAEATNIEATVAIGELGAAEEIVVRNDGHGMPHAQVADLFLTHGESWKRAQRFSPGINRPLHGQLGRGRFLVYGIADRVEWRTVVADGDTFMESVIHGARSAPNQFSFEGPQPTTGPVGTTVRMQVRQAPRAATLGDGDLHLPLTARLAASLLALPDVTVLYRGHHLDPRAHIAQEADLPLDLASVALHGKARPTLRVVEWSADMRSKALYLCDERGAVVIEHKLGRMPPAPIHWTAYLQWEGFRDPALMGPADLHVPDIRHGELLGAAHRALTDYLSRRLDEQKGSILAEWKAEGVYPYQREPRGPAEEVEREVFDIVAVVASPAIGRDVKQKSLSLRLLQAATRSEPSHTNSILQAVLDLTDEEKQILGELLERTRLASIVRAAQTVADRSDFLLGLRGLLYRDRTRKVFREVDQLHPMLVNEPWIFGDEWSLALSESGLTGVVRTLVTRHNDDAEFAPTRVVLPSGKRGRVDMVFTRHLPESERTRHLVVELKRPMLITMKEFAQINTYASAITGHPEVVDTPHDWDFWLVGTDIDDVVRNQYSDRLRPGLTTNSNRYRVWVMTWGQLLDHAERRVQAFRAALDLVSTDETSRTYLQARHADLIPALPQPRTP